ncbi:hypothetical protein BJX99DRAFT_239270 [Aspergillus californicus]
MATAEKKQAPTQEPEVKKEAQNPQIKQEDSEDDYSDEYDDEYDYSDDDYSDDDDDYEQADSGKAMAPYQSQSQKPGQSISSRDQESQQQAQNIQNGAINRAGGKKKTIDDEEGLKLKLDVNLDIEIELKARIHGDLTLALLA